MSNQFGYRCPACGKSDEIDVRAYVWIRLTANGTDADASGNGHHEWNSDSGAECGTCGYSGTVLDFDPDKLLVQVRQLIARCHEQGVSIDKLVAEAKTQS